MAIAGNVLDVPTKMAYYFGIMPDAIGTSAIVEAVQDYLASWSKERISSLQESGAHWTPFDAGQRPLQVSGALEVRRIHAAIHCHCLDLRQAGVALAPELLELDEFFRLATGMIENAGWAAVQGQAPPMRTPEIPSHRDVLENW